MPRGIARYRLILFLAAVVPLCLEHAGAQQVMVVSQGLSAAREAAHIYMNSVAMPLGRPLPGVQSLEGVELAAPLLFTPDYRGVLACTARTGTPSLPTVKNVSTTCSLFAVTPFDRMLNARHVSEALWREWPAGFLNGGEKTGPRLVLLGVRTPPGGALRGKVELWPWPQEKDGAFSRPALRWEVEGKPVGAACLEDGGRVAVLYAKGEREVPALMIGNAGTGRIQQEDALAAGVEIAPEAHPVGLALSGDGAWLFVLVTGFSLKTPEGESVSWLHVFDTAHFQSLGRPLEIPGAGASSETALYPAGDARVWTATRMRGTGFAQATCVEVENKKSVRLAEYPLAGVSQQFHLAIAPEGRDVAVALDNRLELWPEGARGDMVVKFEDPIRVVRWTAEGLFVGEGNRLHAMDALQGTFLYSVMLQSGWVADVAAVPARVLPPEDADSDGLSDADELRLGTSPYSPDSDADGLPDGSDPQPLTPTPWVETRPFVEFREEAAGRELQTLRIQVHNGESVPWQLSFDERTMPWLRIYPFAGQGSGYVYMAVDPARYARAQAPGGELRLELNPGPERAAWNTAVIQTSVIPGRPAPETILWIWPGDRKAALRDPSDPHKLGALADLLAGPPYYFAHREAASPYHESLDPYSVVVLSAEAAAQGALTRQAVLDYVAQGGSLLFLGHYLERETSRGLAQWLSPLAIHIYTHVRVDGRFEVAGDKRLVRYWRDFLITDGCAIGAEKGYALERGGVPGVGAVFVAREYGLGRIALLAAPTPLESDALAREEERAFAGKLFSWLAGARREYSDSDEDGLPDGTEDANDNGTADPGETDYQNPDTDADGLPDGVEDANRNGSVDDGETDPRNPDSDGDGVLDGADSKPCPIFGSPVLFSVTPNVPAEGGRLLVITGANFTADSEFWFGERKASWSRTLGGEQAWAIVPDSGDDEGGIVPVKVKCGGGTLEGSLPGGYQYLPRSRVRFTFGSIEAVHRADRACTGEVALRYEAPNGISLGRVALLLHDRPQQGFSWKEARPGMTASVSKRAVTGKVTPDGFLVNLESGNRFPSNNGELARLVWQWEPGQWDQHPIPLEAGAMHAFTRKGDRLAAVLEPFVVDATVLTNMAANSCNR